MKKLPELKIPGKYQVITREFPDYPYLRYKKLSSRGEIPNLAYQHGEQPSFFYIPSTMETKAYYAYTIPHIQESIWHEIPTVKAEHFIFGEMLSAFTWICLTLLSHMGIQ